MSESEQHCRWIAEFHAQRNPPHEIETPAQFLLARGTVMQTRGKTPRRLGIPRACYYNAYKLARRRKNLHYAEGFAASVIITEHAWCVDAEGRVVDPTWGDEYIIKTGGLPTDYFGMTFDLELVRAVRKMTRTYSVLWDFYHWRDVYPILAKG